MTAVEVCQGPECGEYGGPQLLEALRAAGYPAMAGHCRGLCHYAPVASVDDRCLGDATPEKVLRQLDDTP